MHSFPCECCEVYIWQARYLLDKGIEHPWHTVIAKSRILRCSLTNPGKWTRWSGRWSRFKSIPAMWTGRRAFSWAGHGNLTQKEQRRPPHEGTSCSTVAFYRTSRPRFSFLFSFFILTFFLWCSSLPLFVLVSSTHSHAHYTRYFCWGSLCLSPNPLSPYINAAVSSTQRTVLGVPWRWKQQPPPKRW
jgi:hypothetical protein